MKFVSSSRALWRQTKRAFTLMELMIVLVILSLLVGLAAFNLAGISEQGEDIKVQADFKAYTTQLQLYRANAGRYPTTAQGLEALHSKPTEAPVPTKWRQYMTKIAKDPWQQDYQYAYPGKHNTSGFDLWSLGPNPDDPSDDIGNWE